MSSNRPIHTVEEFWPVQVAIFENEDGNGRKHYSLAPSVSYKDGEEWKKGSSFSETGGDSYRLTEALTAANHWVARRKKANHEASREEPRAAG